MNPHRTAVDPRRSQSVSPLVASRSRAEIAKDAATAYYQCKAALAPLLACDDLRTRQQATAAQRTLVQLWGHTVELSEKLKERPR